MEINYKKIGARIRTARKRKGYTQEFVSEKSGLSVSHTSNIETGSTKLSLPTLVCIANVLFVSVDQLLCDNVECSHHVFQQEAQQILSECSESKIRILVHILKCSKETLRQESSRKNHNNLQKNDI